MSILPTQEIALNPEALARLFAGSPTLKAPLVEPVFTATIQHCLSNKFALRLLLPLLTSTSLKVAYSSFLT